MTHAEAHERLADLALEPAALEALVVAVHGPDTEVDAVEPALAAHVRACQACLAELRTAGRLDATLRASLGERPTNDRLEAIVPPPGLRATVLAAARRTAPAEVQSSWWTRLLPRITGPAWGTAVAALLVVALLGGIAGSRLQQLAAGSGDSLAGVVGTVERVLQAPGHQVVALRSATGSVAGSVAWSHQDFAVLTSSLPPPPDGEVYRCWLAWGSEATTIGEMDFAGGTAYWTGTTGSWASVTLEPGTRFLVTLEPAASPAPGAGPGRVILQADLSA